MQRLHLIALVCNAAVRASAGEPTAFAATSQVRQNLEFTVVQRGVYTAGQPAPLLLRLRNARSEALTLRGARPLHGCSIELFTKIEFDELPPTRHAREIDSAPDVGERQVAAGATIEETIDLARLRDLTAPGNFVLGISWSPDPDGGEPLVFHFDLQDIVVREQDSPPAADLAAALPIDAATRIKLLSLAEDALRGQHSASYEGSPILRLLSPDRAEVAFPCRRPDQKGLRYDGAYDNVVVIDRTAGRVTLVRMGE